jgi:uncharacterized protein
MAIMAGNQCYRSPADLPERIPVFPLRGALLLPSGQLPLNIFEPRYVAMIDAALRGPRLVGMIQPKAERNGAAGGEPPLCEVGCVGRLIQLGETGDGRYLITLAGICRFRVVEEVAADTSFRQCRVDAAAFAGDFDPHSGEAEVDREALLRTFRAYLEANGLEADWESIDRASNCGLVTALSMMSPWGPEEKQALLEAPSHRARAEALIAITEMALAGSRGAPPMVQ